MNTLRLIVACAALGSLTTIPAFAQGTAFTYQGVLSQSGAAVNGSNDLTFTLFNAPSGGATVGTSNVVNDLVMSNGLFAVTLDFGAGAFDGAPRWLQIAARPGASTGGYTNLAPRTSITATPYAIYAGGVSAAGLVGTLPASALAGVNGGGLIGLNATNLVGTVSTARLSTNVALRAGGNSFGGNQSFSGGELSLAGTSTFEFGAGVAGKEPNAGRIGYETFTPGALDIVGAGTNSGGRIVQLWDQVHVGSYNFDVTPKLIRFGDGDFVSIGESNEDDRMELTAGKFVFNNGRVGIGVTNPATKLTVSEGAYGIEHTDGTRRLSTYVDESGCYFGTVSTDPLFFYVNDGAANMMVNTNGRVGIGTLNPAATLTVQQSGYGIEHTDGPRRFATYVDATGCYIGTRSVDPLLFYVNDGAASMVIATNGNVGIGVDPTARLDVGGTVRATSFMGDGSGLTGIAAASVSGTLGAAQIPNLDAVKITAGTVADARLSANVALRAGGNTFSGQQIVTGGNVGIGTTAPGFPLNFANAVGDKIALFNNVAGQASFGFGIQSSLLQIHTADVGSDVAFGYGTSAAMTETMRVKGNGRVGIGTAAPMSSIGYPGGWNGLHTSSPGGSALNIIQGTFSSRLHLRTDNNITNVAQDFVMANGANQIDFTWLGSGLGNRLRAMTIDTNGNVGVAGEVTTTAVNITSDRNAKEQFKPVNAREVLDKVAALPITEWQYKTQSDARHIGPMAQDFRAAFGVGRDEKHITSVDADGVALAAIQGLNEVVREQRAAIEKLEARNQELEERLASRLAALEKLLEPSSRAGRP